MGWSRETVLKVAKRTGYPVVEAWSSHNKGLMGNVYGPMLHHTGSTGTGDYPTLRVVRDGRPGLENSLSMYGLGKSGRIYCISEKLSWHAGAGNWRGITNGNAHFAGIEAESSGNGTDWTPQQLDSYKKLVASILMETGRGVEWAPAHKEYALPAGRKPDPAGINMASFRADVQKYLNNPSLLGAKEGINDMAQEDRDYINQRVNELAAWIRNELYTHPRLANIEKHLIGGQPAGKNNFHWVVAEISKVIASIPGAQVDTAALEKAIQESVSFTTEEISKAVNDEADRRDRDGNPETGRVS